VFEGERCLVYADRIDSRRKKNAGMPLAGADEPGATAVCWFVHVYREDYVGEESPALCRPARPEKHKMPKEIKNQANGLKESARPCGALPGVRRRGCCDRFEDIPRLTEEQLASMVGFARCLARGKVSGSVRPGRASPRLAEVQKAKAT